MGVAEVVVEYVAKTDGLKKGLNQAESASKSTGDRIKSMGKTAVMAAGAAGLGALVATAKIGIDEFSEAAKVGAQTEAVLKSTGGAAKVSAGHVADLAGALMNKSGVDDEAIQSGENLLLTFTQIQNQAGKGNKIFDRATQTMLDMSVALGQDTKQSAIQLGKALNDPVKGVTALRKVGVSFTQAQQDQIKALVKSGKTMEAQKLILGELNKEFGGSAEAAGKTLPGQIAILRQNFNNLAGSLVSTLVPVLSKVAKLFTEHPKLMKYATLGLLALSAAAVTTNLVMAAMPAIMLAVRAATLAWSAAQWLLNAALLANPLVLIVAGIVALVAAIVIAYKKIDWFRKGVNAVFDAIKKAAQTALSWLKSNWPLILAILGGPFVAAIVVIVKYWGQITAAAKTAVSTIKTTLNGFVSWLSGIAKTIGTWVGKIVGAFAGLDDPVKTAVSAIKTALNGLTTWLSSFVTGLAYMVGRVLAVFRGLDDPVKTAVASIKSALNGLVSWLSGLVAKVSAEAGKIANAIKAPLNAILKRWNSLEFSVPKIKLPSVKVLGKKIGGGSFGGWSIGFPNIPLLAEGGVVMRPTLAMLGERGPEAVVPLSSSSPPVEVRVFIGETELRGMVRSEVRTENNRTAQVLLGGLA